MPKKLNNLRNSLQTRIDTAYTNANGDSALLQSSFRFEMNAFTHKLPSLLTHDAITKHTAMPMYPEVKFKFSGGSESTQTYTVKKGDTLWGISRKLTGGKVSVDQIQKLNGLKNDKIVPGQELTINYNNPTDFGSNIVLHYPQMGEILHPDLLNQIICAADKARIEQPHAAPFTNIYVAEKDGPWNHPVQNAEFRPLDRPYREEFGTPEHHGEALEKIIITNDIFKTTGEYAEHFSKSSVGKNLKIYENGWGGNQYVKTVKFAKVGKVAGKYCFFISLGLNTTEIVTGLREGNNEKVFKAGLNMTISVIATFGGPLGWAIGAGYLLLDIAGVFDPAEDTSENKGSTYHYVSPVVPIDHTRLVNPFITKYKID